MSGKKKGKQAKGYVPGDFHDNFMRAGWGKTSISLEFPNTLNPDLLRQHILLWCCGPRVTQQIKFFTCSELVRMARQQLDWPSPTNKNENDTDRDASARRQMRKICSELGIKLKKARIGRPPKK